MKDLASRYTERFNVLLKEAAVELKEYLEQIFSDMSGVCWVSTRAKSIDSFLEKAQRTSSDLPRYLDPINEIQDQLGALIITRFRSDLDAVEQVLGDYFGAIERQQIEPENESEFGYVGKHFILFIPTEIAVSSETVTGPQLFELQVKTLFQYAWSETNHKLCYKRNSELSTEQRRRMAFVAAQAWGADHLIDELKVELEKNEAANDA